MFNKGADIERAHSSHHPRLFSGFGRFLPTLIEHVFITIASLEENKQSHMRQQISYAKSSQISAYAFIPARLSPSVVS